MLKVDVMGRQFGHLTVIALEQAKPPLWRVRCECGTEKVLPTSYLTSGDSKSCGCMKYKPMHDAIRTHGRSKSKLHSVWGEMIARCERANHKDYPKYGGRGIRVCDRWRHDFLRFVADMGERPEGGILDRIDVNGSYAPENCRWADAKTSSRNRRGRMMLTAFGETKCVAEWLEDPRCVAPRSAIEQRIRQMKWDHERAIVTPSARPKVASTSTDFLP